MTLTSDLYFEIKAAIRTASQRDQYAQEIGEPELATALCELKEDLLLSVKAIDEIVGHAHQWNDSDYCAICGADGRA
jgi:hypothetical protein